MTIRVAILSYPMLFQRVGGLQIKIVETIAALERLGVRASMFNPAVDKLRDFDLVHIFSAANGNHRIVEAARSAERPVVLSPILGPPFSRRQALLAALCEHLTRRITRWEFRTSFGQIQSALLGADRLIVMGAEERKLIVRQYGVDPDRVAIIPNGISQSYFEADETLFIRKYGISEFILVPASISEYKNQLGVVQALKGTGVPIVLIGPCETENRAYLQECLDAGKDYVTYLGVIAHDDLLLPSAYAAASVVVLASMGEAGPQVAPQALAAGTPVVLTRHNGLDLNSKRNCFIQVSPKSATEIREAVLYLIKNGDRQSARNSVKNNSWLDIASKLLDVYRDVLRHP